jgi:hypothetical protein
MKAYKIEMLVVDFDEVGEQEIRDIIENTHYPNRCISPSVKKVESRDIGEWHDDHPLNLKDQADLAYQQIFSTTNEHI